MSTKMCSDCDGDGNCPVCHGKGDALGDEISGTLHVRRFVLFRVPWKRRVPDLWQHGRSRGWR